MVSLKNLMRVFIIVSVLFLFVQCKNKNTCFEPYNYESEYYHSTFLSSDSVNDTKIGCEYEVDFFIWFPEKLGIDDIIGATMFMNNQKIFIDPINSKFENFILFDLSINEFSNYEIEINFGDKKVKYKGFYENKIQADIGEVKQFRIENLYYDSHFDGIKLDIVYFISEKYGVVGSYLTDELINGKKILISPAGNIFEKYIDYSNLERRKLL